MTVRVRARPVGPGPWRTCIICRAVRRKGDLVRIAIDAAGNLRVDSGGGRGAWVCRDRVAAEHATKATKATMAPARVRAMLERGLRRPVGPDALAAMIAVLDGLAMPDGP